MKYVEIQDAEETRSEDRMPVVPAAATNGIPFFRSYFLGVRNELLLSACSFSGMGAWLLAIASLLMLTGCSNPQGDGFYAAEYFVRYLEGEGAIKAEARIYTGKDATDAKPALCESVRFREYEMKAHPDLPGLYQYEALISYAKECRFSFRLSKGSDEIDYRYQMPGIARFTLSDSLGIDKGLLLDWEGPALQQGETIVLIFEKADHTTAEAMVTGPTLQNRILIPKAQLKGINAGEWSVYLVLRSKTEIVESDHSITAESAYYTHAMRIVL